MKLTTVEQGTHKIILPVTYSSAQFNEHVVLCIMHYTKHTRDHSVHTHTEPVHYYYMYVIIANYLMLIIAMHHSMHSFQQYMIILSNTIQCTVSCNYIRTAKYLQYIIRDPCALQRNMQLQPCAINKRATKQLSFMRPKIFCLANCCLSAHL